MTETPQQTDAADQTEPTGVDRGHLRNYERLRRSSTDRRIAGVAGGLGRHLNIDPTVLRVLFVVLCFFGGAGFVLYGAAWLLVPEDDGGSATVPVDDRTRNTVLIIIGAIAALLVLGDSWNGFGFPWPLGLIGLAVVAYLVLRNRPSRAQSQVTPAQQSGVTYHESTGTTTGTGYDQPPPWAPAPTQQFPAYQPKPPKRGPKLFGFTFAAVLIALGVLGFVDVAGVDVTPTAYPALALGVVGVMLVVGAFVGRAGGLILLGIIASLALGVTAVAGVSNPGDNLTVRPTSASDVQARYFHKAGNLTVDLSKVSDPTALAGRHLEIGARVGEVLVILPPGIDAEVTTDISGPGGIDFPDDATGGIDRTLAHTFTQPGSDGTFSLRAYLSAGHIEIRNP